MSLHTVLLGFFTLLTDVVVGAYVVTGVGEGTGGVKAE